MLIVWKSFSFESHCVDFAAPLIAEKAKNKLHESLVFLISLQGNDFLVRIRLFSLRKTYFFAGIGCTLSVTFLEGAGFADSTFTGSFSLGVGASLVRAGFVFYFFFVIFLFTAC